MKAQGITRAAMAVEVETRRGQLNRVLDPEASNVTLAALSRAARGLVRVLKVGFGLGVTEFAGLSVIPMDKSFHTFRFGKMEQSSNENALIDHVAHDHEECPLRPGDVGVDDLEVVPFEDAIADLKSAECHDLAGRFRARLNEATEVQNEIERRVYFALSNICGLHFKPEERGEPYGPMLVLSDGSRSAIPEDYRGGQADVFSGVLSRLKNVPLRTRLADVVWLNTRKLAAAEIAISGYIEIMDLLIRNEAKPRFELPHSRMFEAKQNLTRAFQIAAATKKRKDNLPSSIHDAARRLVDATEHQIEGEASGPFLRAVKLAFRYGVLTPDEVITRLEAAMNARRSGAGPDEMRSLYFTIAEANDEAGRKSEANEARRLAAEESVREAEMASGSGLLGAHVLMNAIAEFRRIRGSKERIVELEKRLREIQPRALEEMVPVSHKTDITDLVDGSIDQVEGLSLSQALGQFSDLARSPSVEKLRAEALQSLKDFPLSAMFGGSRLDAEGRVISYTPTPGFHGDPSDEWIKSKIAQDESLHRSLIVQGQIEPVRRYIVSNHPLSQRHFQPIVWRSWFVPPGHRALMTLGFARFMQGDFASAAYLLIPQLENCFRHALKVTGNDPSKLESDLVQKDPTLSIIVEKYKDQMVCIFGEDLINEVDHLFLYEGGPALRHDAAHGKIGLAAAYSADAVYACWFIYRLVCMTVYSQWDDLAAEIEETVG